MSEYCESQSFCDDRIERLTEAEAEIERLRSQLPDGMKHCTILFKECEKGHGWLTATNWIDHGCPQCEIERLRGIIDKAFKNLDVALSMPVNEQVAEIERLRAELDEADALISEVIGTGVFADVAYPTGSEKQKAIQSFMSRCVDRASEQQGDKQ